MAEEGHIPPRNNGRKKASAPMEHGTPLKILPVEVKLESPDVHLLYFDYFVAVCQLLSNLFVFWNL